MTTLGKCFDIQGTQLVFGDVSDHAQVTIVDAVCSEFEQVAASTHWDRLGRARVGLEPGIPDELADDAYEFAKRLAVEHGLHLAYPSEICS